MNPHRHHITGNDLMGYPKGHPLGRDLYEIFRHDPNRSLPELASDGEVVYELNAYIDGERVYHRTEALPGAIKSCVFDAEEAVHEAAHEMNVDHDCKDGDEGAE